VISLHVNRSQFGGLKGAVEFAGFLVKPIKPSALLEVIGSALRSEHPTATAEKAAGASQRELCLADEIPLQILVVDDHPTNRKFCAAALRKLGFAGRSRSADFKANGRTGPVAVTQRRFFLAV
jgi:PleD family two-component response regulator